GQGEGHLAFARGLDRAGEELAVGHVAVPDAGDEGAPGDPEPDVRSRGLDVDLLAALDPFGEAPRLRRGPLARGKRVAVAREAGAEVEVLVIGHAHLRARGVGRSREERVAPAKRAV